MLILPILLCEAAKQAGMRVPHNPDDFDPNEYPHFQVFCSVQLARRCAPGEHWENAKVIAHIPENEIRTVTLQTLITRGLSYTD